VAKENRPTAIGSRAGELCECGHLEENARLRAVLARATNAMRSEAGRLWQAAYEADRAAERRPA
jgi:hypothetical protein